MLSWRKTAGVLAGGLGIALVSMTGLDDSLAHAADATSPITVVRFPATSLPTFVVDSATGGQAIVVAARPGSGSSAPPAPSLPLIITGVDVHAFVWVAAQVKSGAPVTFDAAWGTVTQAGVATLTTGTKFTGTFNEVDVSGNKLTIVVSTSSAPAETPTIHPDACSYYSPRTGWALRLPGYPNAGLSAKGSYDGKIAQMKLTTGSQAVTMTFNPPNVQAVPGAPSLATWAAQNKNFAATALSGPEPESATAPAGCVVTPVYATIQLTGANVTVGTSTSELVASAFTVTGG